MRRCFWHFAFLSINLCFLLSDSVLESRIFLTLNFLLSALFFQLFKLFSFSVSHFCFQSKLFSELISYFGELVLKVSDANIIKKLVHHTREDAFFLLLTRCFCNGFCDTFRTKISRFEQILCSGSCNF